MLQVRFKIIILEPHGRETRLIARIIRPRDAYTPEGAEPLGPSTVDLYLSPEALTDLGNPQIDQVLVLSLGKEGQFFREVELPEPGSGPAALKPIPPQVPAKPATPATPPTPPPATPPSPRRTK